MLFIKEVIQTEGRGLAELNISSHHGMVCVSRQIAKDVGTIARDGWTFLLVNHAGWFVHS